jgi:protein transport protein HofC
VNGETPEPYWEAESADKTGGPGAPDDWLERWRGDQELAAKAESWRIWHLFVLVAGLAVYFALVAWTGVWLVVATSVLLFAVAVGAGVVLARRRLTQQDSLLAILAIAADRGMPLAPTVAAFADQCSGGYRRRIMNLAAQLDSGATVSQALERVPRAVSRDAILLAHVGERTGRLPQALRMAAQSRASQLPIWVAIAGRIAYILGLLLALQVICGFLLYFILPKFEAIFKDFGISLPPTTIYVIETSHFVTKYAFITAWVPALEVFLLAFLPFSVAGWANFDVPFFDRLLRRRHVALVLRSLSLAVDAGKPIEVGMTTLAAHYPTWWVRRKLIKVDDEVQHGADWIDALRRRGLIRSADAEVLEAASTVGNLAWTMRELGETGERRLAFWFQGLIQTLFPLLVISMGFVVFLLAFAFFSPLVEVIRRLAG